MDPRIRSRCNGDKVERLLRLCKDRYKSGAVECDLVMEFCEQFMKTRAPIYGVLGAPVESGSSDCWVKLILSNNGQYTSRIVICDCAAHMLQISNHSSCVQG